MPFGSESLLKPVGTYGESNDLLTCALLCQYSLRSS